MGGVEVWCVLVLPLLFSSGMALVDTLDGLMMLWAYRWAVIAPESRISFNLFLTDSSAIIALTIGLIEVLGCLRDKLDLKGEFWSLVATINEHSEYTGYAIVAFFSVS